MKKLLYFFYIALALYFAVFTFWSMKNYILEPVLAPRLGFIALIVATNVVEIILYQRERKMLSDKELITARNKLIGFSTLKAVMILSVVTHFFILLSMRNLLTF